jgi:hypothetical protein
MTEILEISLSDEQCTEVKIRSPVSHQGLMASLDERRTLIRMERLTTSLIPRRRGTARSKAEGEILLHSEKFRGREPGPRIAWGRGGGAS